jgi:hypothetical protein
MPDLKPPSGLACVLGKIDPDEAKMKAVEVMVAFVRSVNTGPFTADLFSAGLHPSGPVSPDDLDDMTNELIRLRVMTSWCH